ncbi:uncharacterized protein LOC126474659 [Schistocerca serialis cubense]|uniref:uncharacterized protein LOC126474659 n=1 Tax=Schistocerca serialis cubense TaxID=2023355 RepID=UPI00214EC078|nr:uncharacterized protein LOC126474659 [Schistocerca serialis cubense]
MGLDQLAPMVEVMMVRGPWRQPEGTASCGSGPEARDGPVPGSGKLQPQGTTHGEGSHWDRGISTAVAKQLKAKGGGAGCSNWGHTHEMDEHGQSMLHFAAARAHGRNGLFQLLQETGLNAGYRDELYRTARDVAIQANIPDNIHDIDKWVLHLAANGEREKLMELLLEGYDHILDVENDDGLSIIEVVAESEQPETLQFLQSISDFEERREELHNAVRQGNLLRVRELLEADDAELLAIAKNIYGRSSLHIAVLCQDEEITQFLTDRFPATLKTGDNLERTALHYAMGVEKVEELSTFLIRAGARRIAKDLAAVEGGQELANIKTKGAQETYWVTNDDGVGFEEICRVLQNSGDEDFAVRCGKSGDLTFVDTGSMRVLHSS